MDYLPEQLHPGLSIDCVIFAFYNNELKIPLLKLKNTGHWLLPGGFIKREEEVNEAASRVLRERTGLDGIFLKHFYVSGHVDRTPPNNGNWLFDNGVIEDNWIDWFNQRFVTLGFYALVEFSTVEDLVPDAYTDECTWYSVSNLPELFIDHLAIVTQARLALKRHLNHLPIGLNLLPLHFTMPELQGLYETILGKSLDRRNFQRKMLSYDILEKTSFRRKGGAHKAPWLYQFNEEKYKNALSEGLKNSW